jgi:hypothetical protein
MFKAIKEFFIGKKSEEVAPQAPYKVETPVVEVAERLAAPASKAKQSGAPKSKKPAGARKPAAKKPTPTV